MKIRLTSASTSDRALFGKMAIYFIVVSEMVYCTKKNKTKPQIADHLSYLLIVNPFSVVDFKSNDNTDKQIKIISKR